MNADLTNKKNDHDSWGVKYLFWWFCFLAVVAIAVPGFVLGSMLFSPRTEAQAQANINRIIADAEAEAEGRCEFLK